MQREKATKMLADNGYRRGGSARKSIGPARAPAPAQVMPMEGPPMAPPQMEPAPGIGLKRGGRCK